MRLAGRCQSHSSCFSLGFIVKICCLALLVAVGSVGAVETVGSNSSAESSLPTASDVIKNAKAQANLLDLFKVLEDSFSAPSTPDKTKEGLRQYFAAYETFVGLYPQALQTYESAALFNPPLRPTVENGYRPEHAVKELERLASGHRAIFLNEQHTNPQSRSLMIEVLRRLRHQGFGYFAVETLSDSDPTLASRGFPIDSTGFYSKEPVYGEILREAARLNYKIIPYEADDDHSETVPERERAQAKNLASRIFRLDGAAKAIVLAGPEHIHMSGSGVWAKPMAACFYEETGIRPLTIDQTVMYAHSDPRLDNPAYHDVVKTLPSFPTIFISKNGSPWSLKSDVYDVSVFFPSSPKGEDRPAWLALNGLRKLSAVSNDSCRASFPCLIEARYAEEPDSAIPADRFLVNDANQAISLYLRPSFYRLTITNANHDKNTQYLEISSAK